MTSAQTYLLSRCERQTPDRCWLWTKSCTAAGYGMAWVGNKQVYAHRAAYEAFKGPINGLWVLHRCDNPGCINPGHLFLGTDADNMRDKQHKGRAAMKLTLAEVRAIRDATGSAESIGRRFGIAGVTVLRIKRRQLWSHV